MQRQQKWEKYWCFILKKKRLPFQFNDLAAPSNCGAAMGEFFRECCTRYSIFLSSRNFKILRGTSLLDLTMYKWTWYPIFWVKLISHEFQSFTQSTWPLNFKELQLISSSRVLKNWVLNSILLKVFPTRYLTRLDFCQRGVPIGKLALGCYGGSKKTSWLFFNPVDKFDYSSSLILNKVFFSLLPYYPLSSCHIFLPLISALTDFCDWGLVTRRAQLLITSNFYLPSMLKDGLGQNRSALGALGAVIRRA